MDPVYEDPYSRGAAGLPYIALVKEDGSEYFKRVAWTGTHLDADVCAVVGDNVYFHPEKGVYTGWRIYSRSGRLIGDGDLGQRIKHDGRGSFTLTDIVLRITDMRAAGV